MYFTVEKQIIVSRRYIHTRIILRFNTDFKWNDFLTFCSCRKTSKYNNILMFNYTYIFTFVFGRPVFRTFFKFCL